MSSIVLGDFEISLIRDGPYWWDGGALFGVVPKTLWSRQTPADELNRIPLAFNCYLVRTGRHTILIETGGGDKMDARARERMKLPPEPELLPSVLARHGVDPDSIDLVINSHLHWDHCSGNTILGPDGRPSPTFPRARYFAGRLEWEHAHEGQRDAVSYFAANYDPLVESGQMTLVEDGHEVAPGVRMHIAAGHTRGMMVVTAGFTGVTPGATPLPTSGQTFCFLADLIPTATHIQPSWVAAFDLYPLEAIESKIRWLEAAVAGDWVCGFAHDADLAFARITRHPKTQFRVA
jgi:glyoxylase-like metal-dependent hydrolase (beta-lactamase superfamily II)